MPAICPKCNKPLQLEQIPLRKDVQMNCAFCDAAVRVSLVVSLDSPSKPLPPAAPPPPTGPLNERKVVIAVEGEASGEMIREVLAIHGFEFVAVGEGRDIMPVLEKERPAVVVADVGLPEILGFVIADYLRKRSDLKEIGVILLASIHDKTRYKREPESLYGADDYIERHHIQDQLVPKIRRILEAKKHPPAGAARAAWEHESTPPVIKPQPLKTTTPAAATVEQVFENLMEEEQSAVAEKIPAPDLSRAKKTPAAAGDPASHEAAKRLARIIMSDIALYNQSAIEEGIRKSTIYELLRDEINEGKKLYESRVPSEIISSTDYYREAIEDFIKKKRLEMSGWT